MSVLRGRAWDLTVSATVALTILAAAAGSAIQRDLFRFGREARWAMLIVLLGVGLADLAANRDRWRFRPHVLLLLALFVGLCIVSATWSTSVSATLGRSGGELGVVVALAAIVGGVPARPERAARLLDALLAAVAVVAVGSLLFWPIHPSGVYSAFQPAFLTYPARFQGLEFNPNTLGMLLAVGLPVALALTLDRRRQRLLRLSAAALFALCSLELSLSGSRGGIVAAFGACFVVAAVAPLAGRDRAAVAAVAAAALVLVAWGSTIPQPLPASAFPKHTPPPAQRGIDAERVLPLESEIGNPWWTHGVGEGKRTLFSTGSRGRALEGAVERALERPLLGWGFGNETDAFVNRYFAFDSQNPENAYAGLLLQLGLAGLAAFLALAAACVARGFRAARARSSPAAPAAVGAASGALLLGLSQSYFHGPGGVAYVALWLSLLLCSVLGLSPERARPAG